MTVEQMRTNAAEVLKDDYSLRSAEGEGRKSFRRYEGYRDSGVEWIGEVPVGWEVKPLKFTATINDDSLLENTDPDFEFDYVDIGSVDYVEGISSKETMTFENAPSRARRIVKPGDTIVSTVRTYLRAIASIGEFDKPLIVSTGFAVVRPKTVYADFLAYALKASFFVQSIVARSVGVSYPAVNASEVGNIFVPVPSEKEQAAIATLLDRETAKIDGLIEKQEQLIELLREKRQTIISHAVTKGLNPNAKMKDSGVEWLGKVPEHWKMKKLKHSANLIMGQSPPSENYSYEQVGFPFLQGCAEFGHNHPKPKQFCREPAKTSPRGAILVSVRAPVGRLNFANQEYGIGRGLCAVVPNPCLMDTNFTQYKLAGSQDGLAIVSTGSTYDAVSVADVGGLMSPVPPIEEQKKIATFLYRETAKIDSLIERCEMAIELFKERRTALISDAVTGKIDVRSAV